MADEKIMVIVGEGGVRRAPAVFSSVGLGSCVAVTFYDTTRCIGGLAHIMLPGSRRGTTVRPGAEKERETREEKRKKGMRYEAPSADVTSVVLTSKGGCCRSDPARAGEHTSLDEVYHYADTAIAALLKEMMNRGASPGNIVAKIAGGAKMFDDGEQYERSIGGRNVKSIQQLLKSEQIPVVGEDTGGSHGRNVDFHLDSGRVIISTIGGMNKEI